MNTISHFVTDGNSYEAVYKPTKRPNLKEVAELWFGENDFGKTNKEVETYFWNKIQDLNQVWLDSNRTDFSVYTHPDYMYEVILCFYPSTKMCICNYINWSKGKDINPETDTVFELYPGVGLTMLFLALEGYKNLEYYNDNQDQIDLTNKLFDLYGFPRPVNNPNWREKKYDIMMGFEVIEHFKEPMDIMKDMLSSCKKYYIEATGFKVNHYTGHFDEYIIDGNKVSNMQVPPYMRKLLKEENFQRVFMGYNAKPRIWIKN